MSKVKDHYADGEFEELLEDAEANADSGWDVDFVEDMQERFEQYGHDMFLSNAQCEQIERIANGED